MFTTNTIDPSLVSKCYRVMDQNHNTNHTGIDGVLLIFYQSDMASSTERFQGRIIEYWIADPLPQALAWNEDPLQEEQYLLISWNI